MEENNRSLTVTQRLSLSASRSATSVFDFVLLGDVLNGASNA